MFQIHETYVNETEGYIIGESGWYEPYTDAIGALFRSLQKEYGGCVSVEMGSGNCTVHGV